MTVRVKLFNPSMFPRSGIVTLNWHDLQPNATTPALDAEVRGLGGILMECQVETPDLDDPSLSVLLVNAKDLPSGPEDYSVESAAAQVKFLDKRRSGTSWPGLEVKRVQSAGSDKVVLANARLLVEVSLSASVPNGDSRSFGGALTRVQILKPAIGEVLFGLDDDFLTWGMTKPEDRFLKDNLRALQIDKLTLWDAEKSALVQMDVFDSGFDIHSTSYGPLRAGVTLVSRKACELALPGPAGVRHVYCRLFRNFSIERDGDFLLDRVWVRPVGKGVAAERLEFRARMFNLLFWPRIEAYQLDTQLDWLALRNDSEFTKFGSDDESVGMLQSSLGFASDSHTSLLRPHPYWPLDHSGQCCWSWEAGPARLMTNVARFMFSADISEIAHAIGETWYLEVFKPLLGRRVET